MLITALYSLEPTISNTPPPPVLQFSDLGPAVWQPNWKHTRARAVSTLQATCLVLLNLRAERGDEAQTSILIVMLQVVEVGPVCC